MKRFWPAAVLLACLVLASCGAGGGGGSGGSGSTVPDVLPLGVRTYPAPMLCGLTGPGSAAAFVFTRSMDVDSVDLSDTPYAATTLGWSKTHLSNDTLTITPDGSSWSIGGNLLNFDAADADGNPFTVWYTLRAADASPRYFVSGDTGSDTIEGETAGTTAQTPFQTIQRAMTAAGAGPASILVAASTATIAGTTNPEDGGAPYQGYDAGTTTLYLPDGISLCGGYSTDFAERDPVAYPTRIASTITDAEGSSGELTNEGILPELAVSTVASDSSVTNNTVLDGFIIIGAGVDTVTGFPASTYSGALRVGGALQVRNTVLIAGQSSYAVIALAGPNSGSTRTSQSIWTNNALTGPAGATLSYGLYANTALPVFDSAHVRATPHAVYVNADYGTPNPDSILISNSDIAAETATGGPTAGIFATVVNANIDILRNVSINGRLGDGSPGSSLGIRLLVTSGTATIADNTISGGSTPDAKGLYIETPSSAVNITGNTITGGGDTDNYAVYDLGSNTTVSDNLISGGAATSATGIHASNAGTRLYERNTILGGLGSGTYTGVYLDSSVASATVRANVISGCGMLAGEDSPERCIGIHNLGTGTTILRNTVNGGSASPIGSEVEVNTALLNGEAASETSIVGNLFFTSPNGTSIAALGGCLEIYGFGSVTTIADNDMALCDAHVFDRSFAAGVGAAINFDAVVLGDDTLTSLGNLRDVDPLFVSKGADPGNVLAADVNWRLTAGSPVSVRAGAATCPSFGDRDGGDFGNESGGSAMGAYASPTAGGC